MHRSRTLMLYKELKEICRENWGCGPYKREIILNHLKGASVITWTLQSKRERQKSVRQVRRRKGKRDLKREQKSTPPLALHMEEDGFHKPRSVWSEEARTTLSWELRESALQLQGIDFCLQHPWARKEILPCRIWPREPREQRLLLF